MKRFLRVVWGRPSAARCALSVAGGVGLGLLIPASPLWAVWLVLLICLRTHWICALLGWLAALPAYHASRAMCEALGVRVLSGDPEGWRRLLAQPVLCYSKLHVAAEMGHALLACVAALAVAAVLGVLIGAVRTRARIQHHPS